MLMISIAGWLFLVRAVVTKAANNFRARFLYTWIIAMILLDRINNFVRGFLSLSGTAKLSEFIIIIQLVLLSLFIRSKERPRTASIRYG